MTNSLAMPAGVGGILGVVLLSFAVHHLRNCPEGGDLHDLGLAATIAAGVLIAAPLLLLGSFLPFAWFW